MIDSESNDNLKTILLFCFLLISIGLVIFLPENLKWIAEILVGIYCCIYSIIRLKFLLTKVIVILAILLVYLHHIFF